MTFKKSESCSFPKALNNIGNNYYYRKNIKEIERNGQTFYQYDEAMISETEYEILKLREENQNLMMALADIYELLLKEK